MFSAKSRRDTMDYALLLITIGAVICTVFTVSVSLGGVAVGAQVRIQIPPDANNARDKNDEDNKEILKGLEEPDRVKDARLINFLNRAKRALKEHLESAGGLKRLKRTIDYTRPSWPNYKIACVFDSSYSDPFFRDVVRRAFLYISQRVCVTLVDETNNWNQSDPNWFINHGYGTNSYVKVSNNSGCYTSTPGGPNPDGSPLTASVCHGSAVNVHEMLHIYTVAHVQKTYNAEKYISIFKDNIMPGSYYNYRADSPNVTSKYYDQPSLMHYSTSGFTDNGEETYDCIRRDMCDTDPVDSNEDVVFQELSDLYKCEEVFCGSSQVDCSPGYYTLVKQQCRCVCPSELDPNTNCKSFINQADSSLTWATPLSVFAGGVDSSCPDGFNPTGWLSFCGNYAAQQNPHPVPMPQSGKTIYMPICSKTTPTSGQDDWSWPLGGTYCYIKAMGYSCGGPYNEFTIQYQSTCNVQYNGSIGDVTVAGTNTTMKLCCRNNDSPDLVIDLPNAKPFRLFSWYSCPNVRGMRVYRYRVDMYTQNKTFQGGPAQPNYYLYDHEFIIYLCYYQPAQYGCSATTTLTATNRSVTLTTPGFPSGRTPDKRCFYSFNVPEGAQLRVTFNLYNLSANDKMLVKRFNKWSQTNRIDNSNPPYQFVSEGSYLGLEYWAGYEIVSNQGVNFTVDLLLPRESCYDTSLNGADYLGDTNVSEYYEHCLAWKDTVNCIESPYKTWDALLGYFDGNSCRNPGGKLIQPWCFVYRNGSNCYKRYCDVCNTKVTVDQLNTSDASVCGTAISSDSSLCASSPQRYGCFKSCNLTRASSVVSDCPAGWLPYKDRCFYLSTNKVTRQAAESFCQAQGASGTLFQIRDEEDQLYIREIRKTIGGPYVWISGQLNVSTLTWYYSGTTVPFIYTNWTSGAVTTSGSYDCVFLYQEQSSTGRNGGWYAASCSGSVTYNVACQTDRISTCGQPPIPPDGVLLESPKPSYRLGDRVAVGCNFDPAASGGQRTMLCKKNGWTTLLSACIECPDNWTPYENRCYYFSTGQYYTRPDAEAFCRNQGRNGTLWRIYKAADQTFLRDMRMAYGASVNDHTWASGYLVNTSGTWAFTDSSTIMTYFNWTSGTNNKSMNSNCVYVYREYSSSGRSGGMSNIKCNDTANTYTVACQMDKLSVPGDQDKVPACQAALDDYPNFCTDTQGYVLCGESCGKKSGTPQCTTPSGANYTRTSPNAVINAGEVMTFACNTGYFLTSGDTSRACGVNGSLLGDPPVCSANPSAWDVSYFLVRSRATTLTAKLAIILDYNNFRIPLNGKITAWYYYCQNPGTVYFLVYRKSGSSYNLRGYNQVTCQHSWSWRYPVPSASQISVLKNDMIGAYSPDSNTLSITNCKSAPNKIMLLPTATAANFTVLQSTTSFSTMQCIIPALSCRVQP